MAEVIDLDAVRRRRAALGAAVLLLVLGAALLVWSFGGQPKE